MMTFADRFTLQREIGAGGMSRVYLARDEVLERPVAVKVLKAGYGETDIGARFRREGRTAARLSHPNIVQVYDAGEDELEGSEVSYIVMEYLPGGDLKALIERRGMLSAPELATMSGVAAGLAHAHGRGVIHRDIKPHNVLLDEAGVPKLADFGIARALDATTATRTGSYLGTALYSSPEQLQGARVTPASDVYSLGATLYHAATGEPPFVGAPIEVASQHLSREPAPPARANPDVSPSLERLILECLAKDPDARPTAEEVRLGILEADRGARTTEEPVPPPASRDAERAGPRRSEKTGGGAAKPAAGGRRRVAGLVAAVILVALVAVGGALTLPALLEGEGGGGQDRAQNDGDGSGGGDAQGSGAQAGARNEPPGDAGGAPESGLTGQGAVRTVEDFYSSAANGNYDRSAELLADEWRQRHFSTRQDFEGTFDGLQSVRFDGQPAIEVSGDTATVSGETIARHADRTERNEGTWTLQYRDGGWEITRWTVTNVSTDPA